MTDDSTTTTDAQTQHKISESADKITVKLKLTRGEGTRDQDKGTIKAKGDSPEAVADDIEGTLDELEARDLFGRVRGTQPGENDE
jgi:hypothetical protein